MFQLKEIQTDLTAVTKSHSYRVTKSKEEKHIMFNERMRHKQTEFISL